MNDLKLNDLLCLTDGEIRNSKIVLNFGKSGSFDYIDIWSKTKNVDYSYWSHYGESENNQKNFKVGQRVFGFVRIKDDKYLLVTVGDIVDVPNVPGFCKYINVEKYNGFIGRLVIEINKGNTYSRYVFNLEKYIYDANVVEILPKEYESVEFKGFDNVYLKFSDLKLILNNEKYSDYRIALSSVKGIYCLTDTKEGKLYIGAAYGENGIAQRWNNYLDTATGGNKSLIELYNSKGENYFQDNFTFTLIEFFSLNTDVSRIIEREQFWKKVFSTKDNGYNNN